MLTTLEDTSLPAESSPACESATCMTQMRRQELTNLLLTEKNYFLRLANVILRNEHDAEDVVHTSFCAAWKAVGSFRGDSSMKTWFSRVVSNHAITCLRKRNTGRLVFFEDNPEYLHSVEQKLSSMVEDPEKIFVREEALGLVNKHVRSLPAETRLVLMLHFSDHCSIEKIAEMRGKSSSAVSAHLQRGKALLRKRVRKVSAHRMVVHVRHEASS